MLYTWSKWLPEILYAHQGRDLVVIIPNESSPDEYSHGSVASPREASIYVPLEGTYKRVARVPWERRFEKLLAAK